MKRTTLIICLLAMAMMACRPDPQPEPDPNIGGQPEDTTGTVVKKFLVKELLNDDPESIRLAIEWNEDCTQILHVKYGLGYGSIVDYDFKYYGQDSIRIILSVPPLSYPLWQLWYDSVMIHLQDDLIDSINCFSNGNIRHTEYYYYDSNLKLVERTYLFGSTDNFRWDGDNVVEANMFGRHYDFKAFTGYINPYYTLPFYLSNYVAQKIRKPLFSPLWKYQPVSEVFGYEVDEDNYVVKAKSIISDEFYSYYYVIK